MRVGGPQAGGRGIETPFGIINSANLTPDPETGLGRWSADDLGDALRAADRARLGLNAPPDGLYFVSARYPA